MIDHIKKTFIISLIVSSVLLFLVFGLKLELPFQLYTPFFMDMFGISFWVILGGLIYGFFIEENQITKYLKVAFIDSLILGVVLYLMASFFFFITIGEFFSVIGIVFLAVFYFVGFVLGIFPKYIKSLFSKSNKSE